MLRLATLVCLEQIEYESFVPSFVEAPMVLRDALTLAEDLSTVAAMVRWEALESRRVWTPDQALQVWARVVSGLARRSASGLNEDGGLVEQAEYSNDLDARRHLQRYVAVLSWTGQAQWREHIEPVDQVFRDHTERQEIPLVLVSDAKPGAWWDYRLPIGVPASDPWVLWPIKPTRYVAGRHGGGLRTISHVWELAKRPCGLRAMTAQELDRWARLCANQAEAIARRNPDAKGWWPDQHEAVQVERRRRAAEHGEIDRPA